jgi:hypothetical protein
VRDTRLEDNVIPGFWFYLLPEVHYCIVNPNVIFGEERFIIVVFTFVIILWLMSFVNSGGLKQFFAFFLFFFLSLLFIWVSFPSNDNKVAILVGRSAVRRARRRQDTIFWLYLLNGGADNLVIVELVNFNFIQVIKEQFLLAFRVALASKKVYFAIN